MYSFRVLSSALFSKSIPNLQSNIANNAFFASKSSFENSNVQVSVTDDGQTIVCLHEETKFPYEHSRPLPEIEEKFVEENSVLKLECLKESDDILHNKDYSIEELQRLTYTNKHIWYPNNRWKRKPFPAPIPRAGI